MVEQERLNNSSPVVAKNESSFGETEEGQKAHSCTLYRCDEAADFNVEESEEPIDFDNEAQSSLQMLRRVEKQFCGYFMMKVGPSKKTEAVRESVFSTLTEILEAQYGKSLILSFDR